MNPEPRQRADYSDRQIEAAHRVLVDLGQVLAKFEDCLVVVGGWVPDLLLVDADEPHIGSIDVDLALDASKLNAGRYADILKLLLFARLRGCGSKNIFGTKSNAANGAGNSAETGDDLIDAICYAECARLRWIDPAQYMRAGFQMMDRAA